MDVFDYIEKELDRIEVGYTSYDGTRLTMSIDDVRELIENLRKKLAQNLPNACTDTISRQAVYDAIFSEPLYKFGMKKRDADVVVPAIYEKIKSLPSAQPKSEERTAESAQNVLNGELISKKAAIDALMVAVDDIGVLDAEDIETVFAILPSAQPEITWCKDCKFYREYGCQRAFVYPEPEDFCSRAERREE